jgi:hypothetical protein
MTSSSSTVYDSVLTFSCYKSETGWGIELTWVWVGLDGYVARELGPLRVTA